MKSAEIQEIIDQPIRINVLAHGTEPVQLLQDGSVVAMLLPVKSTSAPKSGRTSLKNPTPPHSAGAILKPSNSRTDLLEDFFDIGE